MKKARGAFVCLDLESDKRGVVRLHARRKIVLDVRNTMHVAPIRPVDLTTEPIPTIVLEF